MRPHSAPRHGAGPRVIRPVVRRTADTSAIDVGGADAGKVDVDRVDVDRVDVGGSARVPAAAVFDRNVFPVPSGRAPTADEIDAIARAVFASPLVALVPAGRLQVTSIIISTGPPDWAFAALLPHELDLDPAVAVLRFDVSGGWVLDQVGTAEVGVGLFSPRVSPPVVDESDHDRR
ncbi:hypothetical protein [Frankia sp. Cas4]|uniref:hypothetical protein n=1 Tax=Frankia sp. Cas4 TaxID=3073927 RepID=UPI002AD5A382|nr:hypothetical protein [Frankia sp. Cas4]